MTGPISVAMPHLLYCKQRSLDTNRTEDVNLNVIIVIEDRKHRAKQRPRARLWRARERCANANGSVVATIQNRSSVARATAAHHQHLDIPATAPPFEPRFNRDVGTVGSRHISGVGLVLVPARLTPDNQLKARFGGVTKGHR